MKLTAAARKKIPSKDFALPEKGAYPVEDAGHARAALRLMHNASPEEQKRIRAKVHAKFPGIGAMGKKARGM